MGQFDRLPGAKLVRPWRERELEGKGAPERGKRVLEPEEFEEPEATEA